VKKYLPTLLEVKKWQPPVKNIRIANFVLIKNYHEERRHWPLGRIIKYYPKYYLAMVCLKQGSAFLAHFDSFGSFLYGMALLIVGGDFLSCGNNS
jgi:hypothetical protein